MYKWCIFEILKKSQYCIIFPYYLRVGGMVSRIEETEDLMLRYKPGQRVNINIARNEYANILTTNFDLGLFRKKS